MKYDDLSGWLLPMGIALLCGCGSTDNMKEEGFESVWGAMNIENAITPNALTPNGFYAQALDPSKLHEKPLNPNDMDPEMMAAIRDPGDAGKLSRLLLAYMVSCALSPHQSFAFSWTDKGKDVHDEVYVGNVDLANQWARFPLPIEGQRWVSACLAARTNWYGVSVTLSARGGHKSVDKPREQEKSTYAFEEGAFWGNIFQPDPRLNACYHSPNVAHSRAQKRDCASGNKKKDEPLKECGIIHIAGPCETTCSALDGTELYHPDCAGTAEVITVFLH